MVVELHCIKEGTKLRVRITAYINSEGKRFDGVYNNKFNCRFPKNLRVDCRCFTVPDENVRLVGGNGKAYFYSIKTKNIVSEAINVNHVYKVSSECVVCMDAESKIVFAPCGHFCTCDICAKKLKYCCICRGMISSLVSIDEIKD